MAMKDDAKSLSFVEDTAVPPERLSEYIGRFLALLKQHGTTAGIYAHASVGCLHVRPVVNLKTEEGVRQFETIAEKVKDLTSPGLYWCVQHGLPMRIIAPQKLAWPPAYREATEKYWAQVKLSKDGLRDAGMDLHCLAVFVNLCDT